jgi:DNA-binding HxlR family transcriptional regulator
MRIASIGDRVCAMARAISVVGDSWTLLVLRELFLRARRFDEFQAFTGMAPYLLSRRLAKLVKHGIVHKQRYSNHPPRYEYRLTDKGLDLYTFVVSLSRWGDRWENGNREPGSTLTHKPCGHVMEPTMVCSECGKPLHARHVHVELSAAVVGERRRLRARHKQAG